MITKWVRRFHHGIMYVQWLTKELENVYLWGWVFVWPDSSFWHLQWELRAAAAQRSATITCQAGLGRLTWRICKGPRVCFASKMQMEKLAWLPQWIKAAGLVTERQTKRLEDIAGHWTLWHTMSNIQSKALRNIRPQSKSIKSCLRHENATQKAGNWE